MLHMVSTQSIRDYESKDLPPQSWKIKRMAARAFLLQIPSLKKLPVSSWEMLFHTAGQPELSRPLARANSGRILDTSDKEKAVAIDANGRIFVRSMLGYMPECIV